MAADSQDRPSILQPVIATGGTSPAASGPGGANFEAKVGAYYLLTLLLQTAARGLRSDKLDSVGLQRVNEGFPLDDVVLHTNRPHASSAVLQIQVKRTLTFAASDVVFKEVVQQIVRALAADDVGAAYGFAVATARSSHKIDGPYQQVLQWARDLDSTQAFFGRLNRAGAASDDMRKFVATFRKHVASSSGDNSDAAMWQLLRRFRILMFDFTALEGQSEALALEQCVRALTPADQERARALWSTLQIIASDVAVNGGKLDANALRGRLAEQGFGLAASRKNEDARRALAEMSEHALRDIGDHVGNATLSRHTRVAAVEAARDKSRYVEIRGDGGVGKSGVLKAMASQFAQQSNVIVLSPNRAPKKGWLGLRAMIGYDGTARELLSELASSGGATLFVDSLDYFGQPERAVVCDLVDEASKVRGFDVVVTTRRDFGNDEPNWLPAAALTRLGEAQTVDIDELSKEEVQEIVAAESRLGSLLADGHPAQRVVRNLFRLSRLLNRSSVERVPTTEAEMALAWWKFADGRLDEQLRDRSRILRDLADQLLPGATAVLQTEHHPAPALDALVRSETLRDLGAERMTFRHDVLRDWAVANALNEDSNKIDLMPLDRPIPAALARGVELAARIRLEQSPDGHAWKRLLDQVSGPQHHGSWRRTVLLAVTRSEHGAAAIHQADAYLVTDDAKLLSELLRTVKAVDVMPASGLLPAGISAPSGLVFPSGPSWTRLIVWSLQLGDRFPAAAIPDSVDFFGLWLAVTGAVAKFAPNVITVLHSWLMEIERGDEYPPHPGQQSPFGGVIGYDDLRTLKSELRMYFLQFCHKTPELAAAYLNYTEKQGSHGRETTNAVFLHSGQLAKAAPDALAKLALRALIPRPPERQTEYFPPERREPFTYLDHDLHNVSPAHGPFLELLEHAPATGLKLVRQLVNYLVDFYRRAGQMDGKPIVVPLSTGAAKFTCPWTYAWSREANGSYSVTCALMALEAWAHRRVENGQPVDSVIADIAGDAECPAAFLLVMIDVLISHWPKTRHLAVPYLGIPELLALDHQRQTMDGFRSSGAFDLSIFGEKEPQGLATLESLKRRTSRVAPLGDLLMYYAHYQPITERDEIKRRLHEKAERLGTPEAGTDLTDPAFMAMHAINMLDPANYRSVKVSQKDGSTVDGLVYVPPADERDHLAPGLARAQANIQETVLRNQLAQALEEPSKSTSALVEQGVVQMQRIQKDRVELPDFDRSVEIAAALLLRDGSAEQLRAHANGLERCV